MFCVTNILSVPKIITLCFNFWIETTLMTSSNIPFWVVFIFDITRYNFGEHAVFCLRLNFCWKLKFWFICHKKDGILKIKTQYGTLSKNTITIISCIWHISQVNPCQSYSAMKLQKMIQNAPKVWKVCTEYFLSRGVIKYQKQAGAELCQLRPA